MRYDFNREQIQIFIEFLEDNEIKVKNVIESWNSIVLEISLEYDTVYYGPILRKFLFRRFFNFLLIKIKEEIQGV